MIAVSKQSKFLSDAELSRLQEKESVLREYIRGFTKIVISYSGGVDSSFLAFIANSELKENAVLMLGVSPSVSEHQRSQAVSFAKDNQLNLQIIETSETKDDKYLVNDSRRCYFCKADLYGKAAAFAAEIKAEVVFDGTNFDDLSDVRHGIQAANESNVKSPLAELKFTKQDIRDLSRHYGLPIWDLPASPCLSSRIAKGTPVTIERLSKIERAENILRSYGFKEFRVRAHEELARVEISNDEIFRALELEMFEKIGLAIEKIGFKFVTLDFKGFRSGSLN